MMNVRANILASNCLFVKGARKNLLIDFQNNEWYHIDFDLTENKEGIIDETNLSKIDFEYLVEKQMLVSIPILVKNNFIQIKRDFHVPSHIEYAILDRNNESNYDVKRTIEWLNELLVKFCQIRFFNEPQEEEIYQILDLIKDSDIESVDFVLPHSENLISIFQKFNLDFPKINSIIFSSAPISLNELDNFEKRWAFVTNQIESSDSCGNVNPLFFSNSKKHILKSINYNSCLYKKIGIDVEGNIKNCPSMNISLGHISDLKSIEINDLETEYWHIKKDEIEICKDCEFRYICTDCRVKVVDGKKSRPSTCPYNPYTSLWKGQKGYEEPEKFQN